jgi:hypothetical protein
MKHGAKVKLCSFNGCTNQARPGGVCIRHGAKKKRCSREGCQNQSLQRRSMHEAWRKEESMQQ